MQENIVIKDEDYLKKIMSEFKSDGIDNLHVLADFDRTLTTAFVDGISVPSLISILRDGNYLTPDYAEKAHALFNKYHPIEIDMNISRAEKEKAMNAWWHEHAKLLIDSKLKKSDIDKAVTSGKIKLRDGFDEFFDFLHIHKIPLVIMSSSGLGTESIALYLKHAGKLYDNIHIICNEYIWDNEETAIGVREPMIHVFNKHETMIQNYPAFEVVRNRKNVLLIGDGIGDLGMVEGFNYNHLLTIGFLNDKVSENIKQYEEAFNVVLTNDSSLHFVNKILRDIVE